MKGLTENVLNSPESVPEMKESRYALKYITIHEKMDQLITILSEKLSKEQIRLLLGLEN